MRYPALFFVLLAGFASCMHLKPEGVLVRGSVWLVPREEVRLAVAVARAGVGCPSEPIDWVIVSSRSELYVYFYSSDSVVVDGSYTPPCAVVRKENGRWRYSGIAWGNGLPF